MQRRLPVFLIVILLTASLFVAVRWVFGRPEAESPVALCPGPGAYGYTCETGAALAYVDATEDSGLYLDYGG
jgi:hypothetical protein